MLLPLDLIRAVTQFMMRVYGFKVGDMTESMCVAELMKMYQKKIGE